MRRVIQEDTVRQMYLKEGITEIYVDENTLVTQQAKDYIREKRLKLVEGGRTEMAQNMPSKHPEPHPPKENTQIHPPKQSGGAKYVTEDGDILDEKPEHMTHIYGNMLVSKSHPVIALRGKLDSMEAAIIEVQFLAARQGREKIVADLDEILRYCRKMLSCEVSGAVLPREKLLGYDEDQQRAVSHDPQKYFGVGHLLVDYQMDEWCIRFNRLRTQSREMELAAIAAFVSPEGEVEREDILQGMNRLSSVFYIMMCRAAAKIYK